jgi:hypothetical protein
MSTPTMPIIGPVKSVEAGMVMKTISAGIMHPILPCTPDDSRKRQRRPQRPVLAFMLLGPVVRGVGCRGVGSTGLLASGGVGCTSIAGTCSPCYVSQPGRDLGVLAKSFETFLSGWYLRVSGATVRSPESDPILTAFRLPAGCQVGVCFEWALG